jgi:hypothetical protein
MKKNRKILLGIVFLIIGICFIYILIPKNINHGAVTSGQIISKDYNISLKYPHTISLKVLSNTTSNGTEVITIAVKDVMTWNLIERKRFYFVNYGWKNSEVPVLWQIEHNDKFGDIYKDKF